MEGSREMEPWSPEKQRHIEAEIEWTKKRIAELEEKQAHIQARYSSDAEGPGMDSTGDAINQYELRLLYLEALLDGEGVALEQDEWANPSVAERHLPRQDK